ncbi:MAG: LysR family transcriptional regulator [Candidatus Andeanibacterium colombiense]|uniref:LysR family transcriptional regulator n=1 Tax=Candidatus Andeanibacterium colombiense TaxID=3121345 RepID=A0AAJ6BMR9_9SPHN|nr:MAG: LysR family transcriptional regulator [Sphingomonadaceae bacterium]
MHLDHRLLAAFDAVATHGSVGRAAQALNTTQPTVSRHIKLLEQQLGNPLFERDAYGMHLTAAGADLLPRGRLILHEMELAREMMEGHRGLRRGAIRLGGVEGVARSFLPAILAEVTRRAPHLRIEVEVASEDRLERALANREIDIMFATQPPREVETVAIGTRTFQDRCVVFCAADHPLLRKNPIGIAEVVEEAWAMGHPGATTRLQFERLVREAGFSLPTVMLQTDSVDVIIAMVAGSNILGWLPEPILNARSSQMAITVLNIPELELVRTFGAYRRARGTFPPAGQILLDTLAAIPG